MGNNSWGFRVFWFFFNDAIFHHFAIKIFKFWICNGYNPSPAGAVQNTIEFLTISTTGNTIDFGDIQDRQGGGSGGNSNGHGGLG